MASASAAKPKAVAAQGEQAAQKAQAASAAASVSLPNRREFLYYIWGASMAMILGEVSAGVLWYVFPRFAEGEFGGTFTIDPTDIPNEDGAPTHKPEGRFWISRPVTDGKDSLVILYQVCTHLGCIPKWVDANHRFECPCHGSKYQLSGLYISGPAPRSLDRFQTTITYADGTTVETDAAGDPIILDDSKTIVSVRVDTGARIKRNGQV